MLELVRGLVKCYASTASKAERFLVSSLSGQSDSESVTGCRLWAVVTGRGLIPKHSIEIYGHGCRGGLLQRLALQS